MSGTFYWTQTEAQALRRSIDRSNLFGDGAWTLRTADRLDLETMKRFLTPFRTQDVWSHVWKALEPGVATSAKRIYKGAAGTAEETGRTYDLRDEITAVLTGTRIQKIDVPQSVGFKSYQYTKQFSEAQRIFTRQANSRGTVTEGGIADAYKESDAARRGLFEKMHETARAAIRLGVPEQDVERILSENISAKQAKAILAGTYEPYWPSLQTLKSIAAKPNSEMRLDALVHSYLGAGGDFGNLNAASRTILRLHMHSY